jgi:hypothetical protein
MPRLPTAENLGATPAPSVRRGVSQLQIDVPRLGYEGRALEEVGRAMNGASDVLYKVAEKERQRIDTIKAEEAFNTYSKKLMDMEQEYSGVKGGDVLKKDLYKGYEDKRAAAAKEISDGLTSKEQNEAFTKRMLVANRMFDAQLYRHVGAETARYEDAVDADTIDTEIRRGTLAWNRPGEIELSVLRISKAAERKAARAGVPPEALRTQHISQLHTNVIDMLLTSGQDIAAKSYYGKVKTELTDRAAVGLASKLEVSSTDEEAMRSSSEIWQKYAPQSSSAPVRMFDMEQEARRQHARDPKVANAVISQLRSQAQAFNYQQKEVSSSAQAAVLNAYHEGADLTALQRMPEYTALPGDERVKLRNYIQDRGYTEQQHARAEASYTEGLKAQQSFGRFWELSRPAALMAMSENEILSLEPEIGRELTGRLMTAKRSIGSNVRDANIDSDQFNALADSAGMKPYERSPSAEQKGRLGRLKATVESAIEAHQRVTGRELNREEKSKLMQQEIDKWVMVHEWGRDPKVPAATLKPKDLENVYVPIKDIPPQVTQEYINWMRSEGVIPFSMAPTQARTLHKSRLEKAMGIRRAGGTREQIEAALRGQ